uniref:N6-adenosine-methyltransferase catalytic subunit-like n=1 Tax=Styela clava TaxID=7725 RepID=UPI00193A4B83|nr:N6-adenosine-methyltransferase catalytic subunit-like [Styela clava]
MSSDTWTNLQKLKMKQESLRERIQRRRQGHKEILAQTADSTAASTVSNSSDVADTEENVDVIDPGIEKKFQQYLCHHSLTFPMHSLNIMSGFNKILQSVPKTTSLTLPQVELLLNKQEAQRFIEIEDSQSSVDKSNETDPKITVLSVSHAKLAAVAGEMKEPIYTEEDIRSNMSASEKQTSEREKNQDSSLVKQKQAVKRHSSDSNHNRKHRSDTRRPEKSSKTNESGKNSEQKDLDDIEELLSTKSAKEQDTKRIAEEIQELLGTASTKELSLAEKFRTLGGSQVKEFCPHGTRFECMRQRKSNYSCSKLHFKKLIKPHTDESLGDCSFLNTCFHMDTCKYVHYTIDYKGTELDPRYQKRGKKRTESNEDNKLLPKLASDEDYLQRKMLPPQWVTCDIRYLDMSVLGKFSVIMADPPWDIHMELPYGTMQDDEMRALRIQDLSDDGLFFLWVTGRAMELGRELFECWGYQRCDELIWVKTNQLQRLIRTGRTGHWINHGKEHCLVGIKGNPKGINTGLDCDVLVAEVRDTSHKPDEIYGIIERLSPGTRKLELFGRMHNVQPNWVTLGNQLDGVHLVEPDVVGKFKQKYPDGKVTKPATKSSN